MNGRIVSVLHIDAEFDGVVVLKKKIGNSKRYYIRLRPKQPGYNEKVNMQINSGKHESPRIPSIARERRNLKHVLLNGINNGIVEEDDQNDDIVVSIDTSELEAEEPFHNTTETGPRVIAPLLLSLGVNYVDLSDDKLHVLIGELGKIQFERKIPIHHPRQM